LASSGASCGILVVPVLAAFIIARSDWRLSMFVLGACLLVIGNVAARFMVSDPERMGLQADGGTVSSVDPAVVTPSADSLGWTFTEARATLSFWMFLFGFAVVLLTMTVPFVHIAGFARDIGLPDVTGAIMVSIIGLFSLAGSVSFGALSDRIGRKSAFMLALVSQIAAFSLFRGAESAAALSVGAAAFGLFYGGFASLFPALVADLFGPKNAGTIGGFIIGGAGLLGAWGPALAGYLRDVHGDYHRAFFYCVLTAICALIVFALLPRPRRRVPH
jgi:MFS family permease